MPTDVIGSLGSNLRRAYRAAVPIGFRKALRRHIPSSRPEEAAAGPSRTDPLRFELPLPYPVENDAAGRIARDHLVIEVPQRLYVTRQLHAGGVAGYEAATAAVMLGVAEWLRPEVVFDVGANVGPHALYLPALLDVPVVAFEPAADIVAVLRHLVELNSLACTVVEAAVGDRDGTATLFISPTDTSTSLRAGYRPPTGEVEVPVRTLDTLTGTHGVPMLVKIDTETTEPAVLRGGPQLLARRPWIVCEILPGWTEAEIEGILLPLGYRAYQIDDQLPLQRRETIVGAANLEDLNWLFAPEEPSEELWGAIGRWSRAIAACALPRDLPGPV